MSNLSRGEETRNTILHTALALFSKNGYDATSVAEICQEAEVSKGAFYHHFPSKRDLFLALLASWLDEVDRLLRTAGASAEDIPQALENMAGVSGSFFDEVQGGFPMLLEFWTQSIRRPVFWEKAVEPYRKYFSYFKGLLETGKAEGAFADDLDPDLSARLLMSVAMGLLLQASFDPQGAHWEEVTRSGIKMLVDDMRR